MKRLSEFALGGVGALLLAGSSVAATSSPPSWQLAPSAIAQVSMADAQPIQLVWQPNDQTAIAKQLTEMLGTATPTARQLPPSAHATFFAYMGPPVLHIKLTTGTVVKIYPLYALEHTKGQAYAVQYQKDTVVFEQGKTVEYLKDPTLYRWLKQSLWQQAFHQPQSTSNTSSPVPNLLWT